MGKFIETKIIRGFQEIKTIFDFAQRHNLVICGGYPRYCCSPKKNPIQAGDIDLFPREPLSYESAKAELETAGLEVRNENDISLTFSKPENTDNSYYYCPTIQLIKPVKFGAVDTSGSIENILDNFDFTVVRVAIINETTCLVDEDFIKDETATILRFKNIHCPISSMFRAIKYIKKGYFLKPTEAVKLFKDWDDRSVEYRGQIIKYFDKVEEYERTGEETLTEEELFEFERLMMLD